MKRQIEKGLEKARKKQKTEQNAELKDLFKTDVSSNVLSFLTPEEKTKLSEASTFFDSVRKNIFTKDVVKNYFSYLDFTPDLMAEIEKDPKSFFIKEYEKVTKENESIAALFVAFLAQSGNLPDANTALNFKRLVVLIHKKNIHQMENPTNFYNTMPIEKRRELLYTINNRGMDPISMAAAFGHIEIFNFLFNDVKNDKLELMKFLQLVINIDLTITLNESYLIPDQQFNIGRCIACGGKKGILDTVFNAIITIVPDNQRINEDIEFKKNILMRFLLQIAFWDSYYKSNIFSLDKYIDRLKTLDPNESFSSEQLETLKKAITHQQFHGEVCGGFLSDKFASMDQKELLSMVNKNITITGGNISIDAAENSRLLLFYQINAIANQPEATVARLIEKLSLPNHSVMIEPTMFNKLIKLIIDKAYNKILLNYIDGLANKKEDLNANSFTANYVLQVPVPPNFSYNENYTLLSYVVSFQKPGIKKSNLIKELLDRGALPTWTPMQTNSEIPVIYGNPLYLAAKANDAATFKLLLEAAIGNINHIANLEGAVKDLIIDGISLITAIQKLPNHEEFLVLLKLEQLPAVAKTLYGYAEKEEVQNFTELLQTQDLNLNDLTTLFDLIFDCSYLKFQTASNETKGRMEEILTKMDEKMTEKKMAPLAMDLDSEKETHRRLL